jgi:hypothetical protein
LPEYAEHRRHELDRRGEPGRAHDAPDPVAHFGDYIYESPSSLAYTPVGTSPASRTT